MVNGHLTLIYCTCTLVIIRIELLFNNLKNKLWIILLHFVINNGGPK